MINFNAFLDELEKTGSRRSNARRQARLSALSGNPVPKAGPSPMNEAPPGTKPAVSAAPTKAPEAAKSAVDAAKKGGRVMAFMSKNKVPLGIGGGALALGAGAFGAHRMRKTKRKHASVNIDGLIYEALGELGY